MEGFQIDWTSVLKSPLVLFLPVTLAATALTWVASEAFTFVVPVKYRPGLPLLFGPAIGYCVNRLELLDFGSGPDGWGRAAFFGFFAGVLALLGHDRAKEIWPLKLLARVTPSSPVPPAPPAGGGV